MNSEKTDSVLNNLIRIHNDRIAEYEIASLESTELNLKLMFSRFIQTSKRCNDELQKEMIKYGGKPIIDAGITKNYMTFWEELKSAILGNDKQRIIASCESAEHALREMYISTLNKPTTALTAEQLTLIHAQQQLLQQDYDTIKSIMNTGTPEI